MKEYYRVKYSDYGYGKIFKNYDLSYKGYKIEIESYTGSITLLLNMILIQKGIMILLQVKST